MNRKGFELAISTILLLILGLLVVIAIIYALTGGFAKFRNTTDTLFTSAEGSAVKKACEIACSGEDYLTYCCHNFTISKLSVYCSDERLQTSCSLSCAATTCLAQ